MDNRTAILNKPRDVLVFGLMAGVGRSDLIQADWEKVVDSMTARQIARAKRLEPVGIFGLLCVLSGVAGGLVPNYTGFTPLMGLLLAAGGVVIAIICFAPRVRLQRAFRTRIAVDWNLRIKSLPPLRRVEAYMAWLDANGVTADQAASSLSAED